MTPDYLTLDDGRRVRVLWNMNALEAFTTETGVEFAEIEKPNIGMLKKICYYAVKEGESADGKAFDLTEEQLGRLMMMAHIVEFSKILAAQTSGAAQKKSEAPAKFPKIFFRRMG